MKMKPCPTGCGGYIVKVWNDWDERTQWKCQKCGWDNYKMEQSDEYKKSINPGVVV